MNDALLILLILVGIISFSIVILAFTNRILFKMAVRNFARRKVQSAIVIAGLMIGTSIISASLVVQDTMTHYSEDNVYQNLGEIDEEIWGYNSFGSVTYYDESIYEFMKDLEDEKDIETVAPAVKEMASVLDLDTTLGEPAAVILGLDSQVLRSTVFGDLDDNGFYPDSLADGEIAINSRLADEMDASEGDRIQLSCGVYNASNQFMPDLEQYNFTIAKIIKEKGLYGKANYNQQKTVFLELDVVQQLLNRPDEINTIWISNRGDHRDGEKYSDTVKDEIQSALDSAVVLADPDRNPEILNVEVHTVKEDDMEAARASSKMFGQMFLMLGMFAIIAGIVLIINIFVMLGEERKNEMGIARAIGMRTNYLVRMYIFEGSLYAFVAAIIGAFLGLFFGWVILQAFDSIFGSNEEFEFDIKFFFTWDSVFIAFFAGLLITFATIFFISTRIARLNIIRAIRRIPEPRTSGTKEREYLIGALLVTVGILSCLLGFSSKEGAGWMIGLPLILIGSAMVAHKWISLRTAITVASLLIIFFMIRPFEIPVMSDANYSGAETFVLSGVFIILAGVLIAMFNSDLLLKALQRTIGKGRSTRAVLKTAISYPMDNKFKTGMTLGMFALILFTVTVIAMFASIMGSQDDAMLDEQSGGYDIIGNTNPTTPFENLSEDTLPDDLQDFDIRQLETMTSAFVTVQEYEQVKSRANDFGEPPQEEVEQYQLLGVGETFISNNGFTLLERDDRYRSDREAWEALSENSSYCIVDGSKLNYGDLAESTDLYGVYVGGTITITDMGGQNQTRVLTVIGIMDQIFFFQGILVTKDIVKNEYGGVDSLLLIELGEGEDPETVAKAFEKNYLELGLQTSDLAGMISRLFTVMENFLYLLEGYLGIGLLVGIAGISIISYRNVIERRQQIGMLRAIGFRKSMIAKSFLIESSFITILAIFIGVILGIGISWQMYMESFKETGTSFIIPWMNLLTISLIAYVATLIFTFYPSFEAAKIPPAEALRYFE